MVRVFLTGLIKPVDKMSFLGMDCGYFCDWEKTVDYPKDGQVEFQCYPQI